MIGDILRDETIGGVHYTLESNEDDWGVDILCLLVDGKNKATFYDPGYANHIFSLVVQDAKNNVKTTSS